MSEQPTDLKMRFQWANEDGAQGMVRPEDLEAQGWVKVRQHPNYPLSWLMRKDAE